MAKKDNLEIKVHDGPSRLGKLQTITTPTILDSASITIIPNTIMPLNVAKELAHWSIEETIEKAKEYKENNDNNNVFVVIQGSKYSNLRVKCAENLVNLGYKHLIIANADELLNKPKELCEIIYKLRESIDPHISLCFPFASAEQIPILSYMGIDFFSDQICNFFAELNLIMTPTKTYSLNEYPIYKLNKEDLIDYNKQTLDLMVRLVRENIKNGTLRNLVETFASSSPQNMTLLRIFDKNYGEYIEKYTQLY
jgi:predicted RNA-binding protein